MNGIPVVFTWIDLNPVACSKGNSLHVGAGSSCRYIKHNAGLQTTLTAPIV
jgi:hypothetical protein